METTQDQEDEHKAFLLEHSRQSGHQHTKDWTRNTHKTNLTEKHRGTAFCCLCKHMQAVLEQINVSKYASIHR